MRIGVHILALFTAALAVASVAVALPPSQPSALAGPNQAVRDAKVSLDKANAQIAVIRKRIAVTFEKNADFKAAKTTMDQAKAAYEAAGKKVTAKLEKDADYKELIEKRNKAQALAEAAAAQSTATADEAAKITPEDAAAANKDRIETSFAMKKMEKDAQENDPAYVAARQKYKEAQSTWDTLQVQVDEALKNDPDYKPAQDAVVQAEQQLKSARDSLAQASKAQRDAQLSAAKSRTPR